MSSCACNMYHSPLLRQLQSVCVCVSAHVCVTVFKMKIENQPLLCLALVKVPQRMLSVASFLLLFLLVLLHRKVCEDRPSLI